MARSGFKLARGTATRRVAVVTFVAVVCLLDVSFSRAQDAGQQPAQEQPPATSTPPPASQAPLGPVKPIGSEEQPPATVEQGAATAPPSDTRPLAGAQELTPTLPGSGRSYLIPSASVWEGADSNAEIAPGVTKYVAATIPVGSLALNYAGRTNQFNLDYAGGGIIYNNGPGENGTFQTVTVTDFYNARRWNLLVMDRASYLPQASLGFGGLGYAGVFNIGQSLGLGSGTPQMNQVFVPGQSLLLGRVGTTSNNLVVQSQVFLTSKTSISGVASYGLQDFNQSGLTSSNDRIFVGSIDHQLTSTDTVTFAYNLIQYRFEGYSVALNNNVFQLGYSHRVTSRLSLLLMGGPSVIYSAVTGVPGTQEKWTWVARAQAAYQAQRGSFNLSYLHFTTPGSGLFLGAETDTVSGTATRNLTRTWTGLLSLSFAHNTPLASYSVVPGTPNPGPVNYEVGTLRFNRTMGRNMNMFFVYSVQHQRSASAVVQGSTGNEIFRQIFGVGLEFHPRPWGL